ncbi:MAG TPA: hypothetical protein VF087_11690 [Solirubrobacteraceae bacterium]
MTPLRATLGAIALLMAAAPAGAAARQADPILHDKRLWATINVCDTVGHPDSIGIRGSMPGDGDKTEVMFMRFQVQLYDAADAHWHNLDGADSGFVAVGSARKARQSGNTFTITPPRPGAAPYLLRGAVSFEWREAGQVVRHTRRSTTAAHPNTAGSDPVGFSSATCTIT